MFERGSIPSNLLDKICPDVIYNSSLIRAHPSFAAKKKKGEKQTPVIQSSDNADNELQQTRMLSQVAAISNFLIELLRMVSRDKTRNISTAGDIDEKALKNLRQVLLFSSYLLQ